MVIQNIVNTRTKQTRLGTISVHITGHKIYAQLQKQISGLTTYISGEAFEKYRKLKIERQYSKQKIGLLCRCLVIIKSQEMRKNISYKHETLFLKICYVL